jgi:Ca2+-binding RTX toxin-like protein
MALIKATTKFTTDPAYELSGTDDLVVGKGISVFTIGDPAVLSLSDRHTVTVAGYVSGGSGAIVLGDDAAADKRNILRVAESGVIISNTNWAVQMVGSNFLIDNKGLIGSVYFYSEGPGVSRIGNAGLIANEGTAIGRSGAGFGEEKMVLTNTGTIAGGEYSYYAFGTVGIDVILNRGVMRGDVILAGGNDVYDGIRGGRVSAPVDGGEGNDLFRPGAAKETFIGGADVDVLDFRSGGGVKVALDAAFAALGQRAKGDSYFEIENIQGSARGDDRLRGNSSVNSLSGNGGDDRLEGLFGNDTLTGGTGRDTLSGGVDFDIFRYVSREDAGDSVTDFAASDDRFQFRATGFGASLDVGVIKSGQFRAQAGNQAKDANDRFIFREGDETLWFDRDGKGGAGPILVADLQDGAVMVYLNIEII